MPLVALSTIINFDVLASLMLRCPLSDLPRLQKLRSLLLRIQAYESFKHELVKLQLLHASSAARKLVLLQFLLFWFIHLYFAESSSDIKLCIEQ